MKKMLLICTGILLSSLILELALRFFPVSTGFMYLAVNSQNPILRGTPLKNFTFSKGWNFRLSNKASLNNDGFLSNSNYHDQNTGALLIGDSYVQGAAIAADKNVNAILSKRFSPYSILSLGQSGAAISDYLAIAKWGVKKYKPKAIVFLLVEDDILESYKKKSGGYAFVRMGENMANERSDFHGNESITKRMLNSSKLFLYIFDNLSFLSTFPPQLKIGFMSKKAVKNNIDATSVEIQAASSYFLTEIMSTMSRENILFVIDAKRSSHDNHVRDVDVFADIAAAGGFQVLKLQNAFDVHRKKYGLRLDFSPTDNHWNAKGWLIAADEIEPYLRRALLAR